MQPDIFDHMLVAAVQHAQCLPAARGALGLAPAAAAAGAREQAVGAPARRACHAAGPAGRAPGPRSKLARAPPQVALGEKPSAGPHTV